MEDSQVAFLGDEDVFAETKALGLHRDLQSNRRRFLWIDAPFYGEEDGIVKRVFSKSSFFSTRFDLSNRVLFSFF